MHFERLCFYRGCIYSGLTVFHVILPLPPEEVRQLIHGRLRKAHGSFSRFYSVLPSYFVSLSRRSATIGSHCATNAAIPSFPIQSSSVIVTLVCSRPVRLSNTQHSIIHIVMNSG